MVQCNATYRQNLQLDNTTLNRTRCLRVMGYRIYKKRKNRKNNLWSYSIRTHLR